jgi:hypothetical protein
MRFSEGDAVHKPRGYKFPGIIVSGFRTMAGDIRYVVELITFEEGRAKSTGLLHIFGPDQLDRGFDRMTPEPVYGCMGDED